MTKETTNSIQVDFYPDEVKKLDIFKKVLKSVENYAKDNEKVKTEENDSRKLFYSKCIESINGYFYELIISDGLMFPDSSENFKKILSSTTNSHFEVSAVYEKNALSFKKYINCNFFINFFSSYESSLRLIVKAGNFPNRHKRNKIMIGTENISEICTSVVDELKLGSTFIEVIKLARIIRNAQHNRGFYFSKKDEKVTYKGNEYTFKNGELIPAEINNMLFIFDMIDDLRLFMFNIINSEKISEIKYIEDTHKLWE